MPAVVADQVDGGSEFTAEFEQACANLDIPLYVLPPRRPRFIGRVERANDTTRVEFCNLYDGNLAVAEANRALADHQHFYNHVRPHRHVQKVGPTTFVSQLFT